MLFHLKDKTVSLIITWQSSDFPLRYFQNVVSLTTEYRFPTHMHLVSARTRYQLFANEWPPPHTHKNAESITEAFRACGWRCQKLMTGLSIKNVMRNQILCLLYVWHFHILSEEHFCLGIYKFRIIWDTVYIICDLAFLFT